jgi:type VI secretion system FHA domain protein
VTLTLTISSSNSTDGVIPGGATRRAVFTQEGGTIGRAAGNSWVLAHNKVSGSHAVISYRDGVFYIKDISRNGVAVNSPTNRLVRDRPYALKAGDTILIEPYEIDVMIDAGADHMHGLIDPLADDPFAPAPLARRPDVPSPAHSRGSGEVDPLKFFDPINKPSEREPAEARGPEPDDWHQVHYGPPPAHRDPNLPNPREDSPSAIPADYNPLAEEEPPIARPIVPRPGRPVMEPTPARPRPVPPVRSEPPAPPPPPAPVRIDPVPVPPPPEPAPVPHVERHVQPVTVNEAGLASLTELLAGAGLHGAAITPELAHNLGQILRIVVAGLMDVLQARARIKEEFGMRQTTFGPKENNPLKFSANVEDALHNLLVKRNAAYLGPVDAFADAFEDLRNHQLAMLAGMRMAFEATLAGFDPDKLQEEFDRHLGKAGLPLVPAKMRYWDLFREKRKEMAKDPEVTFAQLFGDDFAEAYEEQFRTLKAQRQNRGGDGRTITPPNRE